MSSVQQFWLPQGIVWGQCSYHFRIIACYTVAFQNVLRVPKDEKNEIASGISARLFPIFPVFAQKDRTTDVYGKCLSWNAGTWIVQIDHTSSPHHKTEVCFIVF